MNKGRIAAIGSVLILTGALGAIARSNAQPKGPKAYDPTPEERYAAMGVRKSQEELNQAWNEISGRVRTRLGVPETYGLGFRVDLADSKGHPGVWVSQPPADEVATVTTATAEKPKE